MSMFAAVSTCDFASFALMKRIAQFGIAVSAIFAFGRIFNSTAAETTSGRFALHFLHDSSARTRKSSTICGFFSTVSARTKRPA